jgi:hypothetical protein
MWWSAAGAFGFAIGESSVKSSHEIRPEAEDWHEPVVDPFGGNHGLGGLPSGAT